MKMEDTNKVTLQLVQKPIILHIVHFMQTLTIQAIVVVVGFARDSVEQALTNEPVIFAEQKELLGTGHAVQAALPELPKDVTDVFVVYGDDAVFYTEKHRPVMEKLFAKHFATDAAFTFLTINQDDPTGLGRIVRDKNGRLLSIVEEKDATTEEKKITEINPGSFVFKVDFLKKYLPLVDRSPVTGEYYLTSLIGVAITHGELVETVRGGKLLWRGVNTLDEFKKAEKLLTGFSG
jgi:bifunctional UDP-N-acetylglucosamine pyrophosphorylase/glucosamine-1-phosphate N-acetyltransferase